MASECGVVSGGRKGVASEFLVSVRWNMAC